jgi:AGCS family alanine or glycine:cation symporter
MMQSTSIYQSIEEGLTKLSNLLWGNWLLAALLGLGILYTVMTGGIQIRGFRKCFHNTITQIRQKSQGTEKGISPVQALLVALGSCVGSGNIVGVSTALIAGGPGALFWMWFAAFFGMATKFGEIVLGVEHRQKDEEGHYVGGPMYYIGDCLKSPFLGALVAVLLFIQNAGGTIIQSNVIAKVVHANFELPYLVIGIAIAVIMIIIINGGFRRLVNIEQKLVPVMACLYIAGGLIVILTHVTSVPAVFASIFREAFQFKAVAGGVAGAAIKYGVTRGLYSNEAGEGSAAVIHSRADVKSPADQGLYGIMEVFVDTMILCTNTGLCILVSGVPLQNADASTLAAQAFGTVAGPMKYIVYVSLILFAFTSLMSQWLFGHASMQYFKSYKGDLIYKIIFPIAILIGSLSTIEAVWALQDCALGLLIIPNIICMVIMSPHVGKTARQFIRSEKQKEKKH